MKSKQLARLSKYLQSETSKCWAINLGETHVPEPAWRAFAESLKYNGDSNQHIKVSFMFCEPNHLPVDCKDAMMKAIRENRNRLKLLWDLSHSAPPSLSKASASERDAFDARKQLVKSCNKMWYHFLPGFS
jgi:hypothetical protein